MSGEDDAPVMIPNPYLAAIRSAKASAVEPAGQLKEALKAARTAMDGNCWLSPLADQFYSAIDQNEQTLSNCQTNALAEFDEAISRQPAEVESTAWQVHWHNLMR